MREPEAMAKSRDVRADRNILFWLAFITKNSPSRPTLTLPFLPLALSHRFFLIYSCFAERQYLPAK